MRKFNMPDFLKKGLLIVAIFCLYFFGVRELRKSVHDLYLGTLLPADYGTINGDLSFYAQTSVSFTITDSSKQNHKGWQFKVPFGSFFLFAVIGLLIIDGSLRTIYVLSGFHLSMGILSVLLVYLGINHVTQLLIIVDFVSRYLLPLGSFGYVAFVYGKMKKSKYALQS